MEKQPEDGIVSAIGNATLVVCSIGASEKEILDVTGPYRIDYMATNKLVEAGMVGNLYACHRRRITTMQHMLIYLLIHIPATAAKVEHFILVTSLGTNRIGFPAFLLKYVATPAVTFARVCM